MTHPTARDPMLPPTTSSLALAGLCLALGCLATPSRREPADPRILHFVVEVGPTLVPCTGVVPMSCLHVRFLPDTTWQRFYAPIEGFTFVAGVAWELEVERRVVAAPPADGSGYRWRLIRVRQRRVTSGSPGRPDRRSLPMTSAASRALDP